MTDTGTTPARILELLTEPVRTTNGEVVAKLPDAAIQRQKIVAFIVKNDLNGGVKPASADAAFICRVEGKKGSGRYVVSRPVADIKMGDQYIAFTPKAAARMQELGALSTVVLNLNESVSAHDYVLSIAQQTSAHIA